MKHYFSLLLFNSWLLVLFLIGEIVVSKTDFTSMDFVAESFNGYSNHPPVPFDNIVQKSAEEASKRTVSQPYGLRHMAFPSGQDAVMGLAVYYNNLRLFRRVVGSLRFTGYDGHIILGVSPKLTLKEEEYLKRMNVTYYTVYIVDCDLSISVGRNVSGLVRGKCSKGLERLKLEWGRFEMARQWLHACDSCFGYIMVVDTRDIFFQSNPFENMSPAALAKHDLFFIEEIAPHSCPVNDSDRSFIAGNFRNKAHIVPCYGLEAYKMYLKRPVLCSGTVYGTNTGMKRFLSILVDEFYKNSASKNMKCRSPSTTDQWTMNYLYYHGRFGSYEKTRTLPWGTGPVQTIGKPCVKNKKTGQSDMVKVKNGYIVNIHEHDKIVPVIHQFDRCFPWIKGYFDDFAFQFK